MAVLRLFAAAREAAGSARDDVPGATVGEVLAAARARYPDAFADVLATSRVWRNGEPAADGDAVTDADEVAVLPPVSGGAVEERGTPPPSADRNGDPDRPHVRLGLLWAAVTSVAVVLGTLALAVWLAVVAALAAAQAARTWRRAEEQADMAAAAAGAAVITVAAAAGPVGLVVGAVAATAAAFVRAAPPVTGRRTLLVAGPVGLACAAPVVLRAEGFRHAFALLALVWAYDAGCYVVGTGAHNRWEGPAAGVATVAAMGLAVAVVFVPPFEGAWPWAFAALVAALAPFAERAGSLLLGDRDARAPVLRRIDSLLAAGPAFAALGLLVL